MLLEFRVKNFRSFRDEQVLSLIPSSINDLEDNILSRNGNKALKIAAIFGPNASGKSNLIKAVDFFVDFIEESITPDPGKDISIQPFLLDPSTKKEPSEFEMVFINEGIRYQYGFSLTRDRIINEWLYAFPNKYAQTWFTRDFISKSNTYEWKFGSKLKGGKSRTEIKSKTLPNTLFLSVAAQWNNEQLLGIYEFITDSIRTILPITNIEGVTAKLLHDFNEDHKENNILNDLILKWLINADLGIKNLSIKKEDIDISNLNFPKDMPEDIRKKLIDNLRDRNSIKIDFIHANNQNTEMILPITEESDGTKRLFELLGPLLESMIHGYTVFIDEFESSLHPLLIIKLLNIFNELPLMNGQIIFTTHNTSLLKTDYFRRDQIWFTEKDNSGASKLYPLYDYKPRKGEAIEKNYLSGRYGAIPVLEEFGING